MLEDTHSLSEILGSMTQLKTLDLGMSDDVADLEASIIMPAPPFNHCRVAEPCEFIISTRTSSKLPLPHGGLQMEFRKTNSQQAELCVDQMDGRYRCRVPDLWIAHEQSFNFVVSADGEDFELTRTLFDPDTGAETTEPHYPALSVNVAPIACLVDHSHADAEGATCICSSGYVARELGGGGMACERCDRGFQPATTGTR
eukprot:SAG22_NODE_420_length_10739_cov_7.090320_8_plen_200_part_00